ncbi:MAG: CBS domain-containing protein [Acidimicrobiales bacterium]
MSERAVEFLDLYADLEKHFRRSLGAENIKSFSVMVKELSKRDRIVSRFRDELLQWHDLRNAIVHERRGGGQVIAEPVPEALAEFERLANVLSAPPKLSSHFQREVARVAPSDSVRTATETMRDRGFAQLPVYDDGGLHGLLTATAVARWLASAWKPGVSEATTVAEVLEEADDHAAWRLLDRDATFTDALGLFDQAHDAGTRLVAIVITHDGKRSQKPIGILTTADLPALIDIF